MLTIRAAQMAALAQAHDDRFDHELIERLRVIWPERLASLDGAGALRFAAHCREKARRYGASSRLDIERFAVVALFLGPDFDEDPAFPWARRVLGGLAPTPSDKMAKLTEALDAWIDRWASDAAGAKGGG